jgi:hypothetical protein
MSQMRACTQISDEQPGEKIIPHCNRLLTGRFHHAGGGWRCRHRHPFSAPVSRACNLEQNMKSRWNSLMVGGCNVVGLALLALSATAGGSAVRAGDPSTLQSTVLEKIVSGLEQQVANLEASIAAFADSFTTKRIATQELCVADGSGAQTCITKAQLDALLRGATQLGQAPAATAPGMTEQTASTDKSVAPGDAVAAAAPAEMPPAIEASGAPVSPPQAVESSAEETAEATPEVAPEVAAVMPSAAEPVAGQPAAASSEAAAPLPAEATAPPPASESAETIVAASAKPETVAIVERPVKDEESAPAGSRETDLATPEVNAAPAEAPPVSERVE